jgi:uncharacterized protein (DUF1697 family)
VALLRGINVGGKNLIPMPTLQAFFAAQGLADVTTYIQSGNVLFSSAEPGAALAARLEAALAKAFRYHGTLVLRTREQLRRVVEGAPPGFGGEPAAYRYDVVFLRAPLAAAAVLSRVPLRPGVDEAFAGRGALYLSRLAARASQSRMSRIVTLPEYAQMTIRNWNTTTKLLALLEAPAGGGEPPAPQPPKSPRSRRKSASRKSATSRT